MILKCADCGIMISVSSTGYGDKNTLALLTNTLFGDHFATRWLTCGTCGQTYCDKCASKRGRLFRESKCECGGQLSEKYNMSFQELESKTEKIYEDHKKTKHHFEECMKKGVEYFNAGKYRDTVEWLGKAIDTMPEMAGAGLYFTRAEAWSEIGEHKLAIQDLSRAIELDPDKSFFYENRGISYFEVDDYESAIGDFTKCLELAPDSAMSYNNRGAAYLRLRNYPRARGDFEKALELNPTGEAGKLAKSNLELLK